jgi:hypothetical protein
MLARFYSYQEVRDSYHSIDISYVYGKKTNYCELIFTELEIQKILFNYERSLSDSPQSYKKDHWIIIFPKDKLEEIKLGIISQDF